MASAKTAHLTIGGDDIGQHIKSIFNYLDADEARVLIAPHIQHGLSSSDGVTLPA